MGYTGLIYRHDIKISAKTIDAKTIEPYLIANDNTCNATDTKTDTVAVDSSDLPDFSPLNLLYFSPLNLLSLPCWVLLLPAVPFLGCILWLYDVLLRDVHRESVLSDFCFDFKPQ